MSRTRIKICGVMRPQDALIAARAGADAIGIVFHHRAGRFVTTAIAHQIIAALPPMVTPVGLFVDEPLEKLVAVADELGLRHIQLHGDEPVEYATKLGNRVIIKAIRVDRSTFAADLDRWRHGPPNVRGIVLETAHTGHSGGSGIANDWSAVRDAIDRHLFDGLPPIIAAGGISLKNVADVIRIVRPWAIDVSSGVEEKRCEKSETLINSLVVAVREADSLLSG